MSWARRIALALLIVVIWRLSVGVYETFVEGVSRSVVTEVLAQTACVPNPNANGPPFINACPIPASGLNVLANAAGIGMPQVSSNSALKALSAFNNVLRLGFTIPGDSPIVSYTLQVTACSLNSGAGDNGSQVQAAGGGCWIIAPQTTPYDVRIWGANGNGTGDNSAALQAAINTNLPLYFPSGSTFRFTSTLTNTTHTGLHWIGASNRTSALLCATVSADCIQIGGGTEGSAQVYGALLENLYINRDTTVSPVGGISLNFTSAAQATVRNVIFDNICNGVFTDEVNTVTLDLVNITASPSSTCTQYGIKNFSSTSFRSDWIEVTKSNIEMNNASGADAWDVDGWVNTGNVTDVNLLNSATGFKATNSAHGTGGKFPTFWNFKNVQIDGASVNGMDIEAGYNYIVSDSYLDNNNASATGRPLLVNPDTGFSNTNVLTFHHSMIEDTPHDCASINALNVIFDGNTLYDCNISNSGYNGLDIGANSQWVTVRGNIFGVTAYSVHNMGQNINIAAGAKNVIIEPDNNYAGSTATIGNSAPPTLASCGTSPSMASQSTDLSGAIFIGSGTVTSCALSFVGTYSSPPISITLSSNNTATGALAFTSISASGFTITSAASMGGDEIAYRVTF